MFWWKVWQNELGRYAIGRREGAFNQNRPLKCKISPDISDFSRNFWNFKTFYNIFIIYKEIILWRFETMTDNTNLMIKINGRTNILWYCITIQHWVNHCVMQLCGVFSSKIYPCTLFRAESHNTTNCGIPIGSVGLKILDCDVSNYRTWNRRFNSDNEKFCHYFCKI